MQQQTQTTTETPAVASFQLTPPEVIQPVAEAQARTAVPLPPETKSAVEDQVQRFMDGLLTEDVQSEAFKQRLDSAFALGREEVSVASSLMQGQLLQRNFVGMEDTTAFKAIQEMRGHLDGLNPGKEGDLFQPQKLLGIIPYGNKLQSYFRKYQSASSQLQKSMEQLYAARDDMQKDVVELEATRTKLWDAMQKLAGAIHFAETLDTRLHAKVESLKATDAVRAKALEQEVLFYVRQNLQDMLTQQAVCTNGYLALDVLKKTGREMMNGCNRVATTGMSALAVAQTVARATGNQIKVMEMLGGVNSTIESLIAESGKQLNTHVEKTAQFAQNPMIGIEKLQEMFNQTFKAMDAMDDFRSKAITVMGQNNAIIKDQLAKAEQYVDRVRQQQAREATRSAISGPVAL
ncbi:toxic anion resistance protein [Caenimonas sedimenti]|uniref:Toxic anion resistance protein n=1 Tax=Caenimonas sedimenti TaxID=2596921 RepID=A0A562ZMB6_9BURK|nr:toxic anion resistance protein [Caenimonas sedimenti]TWO69722.1 toxic anion resistance protein [Caenimonas sedimenti]